MFTSQELRRKIYRSTNMTNSKSARVTTYPMCFRHLKGESIKTVEDWKNSEDQKSLNFCPKHVGESKPTPFGQFEKSSNLISETQNHF